MTDFDELKQTKAQCLRDITEALDADIRIVPRDLAPLKRLTPPMVGSLGTALNSKVTEVFKMEK